VVAVTRGDVALCDLNPVIGTEQAGIRPVVIVQIDRAANFVIQYSVFLGRHSLRISNSELRTKGSKASRRMFLLECKDGGQESRNVPSCRRHPFGTRGEYVIRVLR